MLFAGIAVTIASCTWTKDPATGERTMDVRIPGTPQHEESLRRRWDQCLEMHTEDHCRRRHGPRPPPAQSS